MALNFLHPEPGAKVQVIGAGLPRTGTNSFCAAVSILLDGPTYHAGVQWAAGTTDETHVLTMTEVARAFPYTDPVEKSRIFKKLETILDGYVATADSPLLLITPELMDLYPTAKVICTVRDRDSWVTSMLTLVKTSQPRLMAFIFFWIPSIRYLPEFSDALTHIFFQRYGVRMESVETCQTVWERHYAHLEEVVPKDRLFYFNVKDGWEPLCKALDVPVPDVPFPRLNDAKDLEAHFKKLAAKGLGRWGMVAGAGVAAVGLAYWLASG